MTAKTRLAEANEAADKAAISRRQALDEVRQNARLVLNQARIAGKRIVDEAESKVAPYRRFGGFLGGIWSGFRAVEKRLAAIADLRIAEAQKLATIELARTRETLRTEAQRDVKGQLAEFRAIAKRAECDRLTAEQRLLKAEAASRKLAENLQQTKASLTAERLARQSADYDRERFRAMWADADNQLISLERHHGFKPRP